MFLVPGAEGWTLISPGTESGAWRVRGFASLDDAAQALSASDDFVFALPVSAVLAQRIRLPNVEGAELREMVRIQIEKALPFSADEVTSDFEIIDQVNGECVISAVAVQNQRLAEIAAPLLNRDVIPSAVTVYAAQRLASHAEKGCALFIYPEVGALISAISENGKLSFARTVEGGAAARLDVELPQLALSAELQGIDASFQTVLLDEKCFELLVGAVYVGILALALLQLIYLQIRKRQLDAAIARDNPRTAFVRAAAANWKTLSPAIDPYFYPIEILLHLFESLPSADVRITAYDQSARQISIEGEASHAALAYQFGDKVKKNPGLQNFIFDMQAPRILQNDHAQFRLEGKPR